MESLKTSTLQMFHQLILFDKFANNNYMTYKKYILLTILLKNINMMKIDFKRQLAIAIIALLCVAKVHAQKFYISAGGGYGFGIASNFSVQEKTIAAFENLTYKYKLIKGNGSFGQGAQAGATFGYNFNENIATELNFSYLIGAKLIDKEIRTAPQYEFLMENTLSGHMYRLTPSLLITAGKGFIKPYMRAGLVIGIGSKLINSGTKTEAWGYGINITEVTKTEIEYTGGTSLGFACGMGINIKINHKVGFFAEMGMIAQSWAPEKSEYTKYTLNDADILSSISVSDRITEYVDEYSYDYLYEDKPNKELKQYFPFSSMGLNAGFHFSFGGIK